MLIKKHINYRDISALSVTVLDPAEAVIRDIAAKLHEEKVYIISQYLFFINILINFYILVIIKLLCY